MGIAFRANVRPLLAQIPAARARVILSAAPISARTEPALAMEPERPAEAIVTCAAVVRALGAYVRAVPMEQLVV